uniref:Uncharacterized protein n=1 Tax=Amphimedon queenslandica TaxID=400682 RepID=A0A1X7U7S6_AMPQE
LLSSLIYRTQYDQHEDNLDLNQVSSSTDIAISTVNHAVTLINDETQDDVVNPNLEADINRLKKLMLNKRGRLLYFF